jgi:hypothetical protein
MDGIGFKYLDHVVVVELGPNDEMDGACPPATPPPCCIVPAAALRLLLSATMHGRLFTSAWPWCCPQARMQVDQDCSCMQLHPASDLQLHAQI